MPPHTCVVEVDLYSGRPNPQVRLTPTASEELRRRLQFLPRAMARGTSAEGLGYRGLFLRCKDRQPKPRLSAKVFAGMVELDDGSGIAQWHTDHNRDLERWLINSIVAQLDPPVADYLLQQIST